MKALSTSMLVMFVICVVCSYAQNSVSDLLTKHAAALEPYLSENKNHYFRQEDNLDDDYLSLIRKDWGFGAKFKPNYAVADFNGDRITDFAILLSREGKEEWSPELSAEERVHDEHNPDYPLTLVVCGHCFRGNPQRMVGYF